MTYVTRGSFITATYTSRSVDLRLEAPKNEQATIKHLLCKHLLEPANQLWPASIFSHQLTDCHTHQTGAAWLRWDS